MNIRIISLICLVFLNSCTHENSMMEEMVDPMNVGLCDSGPFNYENDIAPIISMNCAIADGCHSGNHSWGNFTTYNGIVEKIESGDFMTRVSGGTMPPDYTEGPYPMDSCNRQILIAWVEEGYPF